MMKNPAFRSRAALWPLALLLAAPGVASPAVVEIAFDAQGRFAHATTIAPGKFIEVCGELPAGGRIAWSFEAPAALDFNIHYHVGEKVEFPEKRAGVSQLRGVLEARSTEDYCWMWKSAAQAPVPMTLELRREPPAKQ